MAPSLRRRRRSQECPAGVSVSITKIECNQSLGIPPGQGELKVHLANKGRFTVEDVLIRVSNNPDSKFGIEEMPIEEAFPQSPDPANTISPGNSKRYSNYHMSDQDAGVGYKDVKLVDVQPYYMKDGKKTLCKSYTTQKITCGA